MYFLLKVLISALIIAAARALSACGLAEQSSAPAIPHKARAPPCRGPFEWIRLDVRGPLASTARARAED